MLAPLTRERRACYYFAHSNDNQIWPAMRKTSRRRSFDSDLGQSGSLGEARRANALPSGRRKKVSSPDGARQVRRVRSSTPDWTTKRSPSVRARRKRAAIGVVPRGIQRLVPTHSRVVARFFVASRNAPLPGRTALPAKVRRTPRISTRSAGNVVLPEGASMNVRLMIAGSTVNNRVRALSFASSHISTSHSARHSTRARTQAR